MLLLYNEINDVITEGFCLIVTVVQSVKWAFEYTSWEMGKKKKTLLKPQFWLYFGVMFTNTIYAY